ncbi:MAG: YbaN family protein [Bacteroidales bacterium]|nr:YbaN family protein [Bacteroidales bacterium]
MKRQLYIILASIFVGLGTIGIFLPLVPTTPFLLLATYFYMNSSQKRLRWLLRNRLLGPYIRSYLSKEGIPLQLKIRTLILLWATILYATFFATDKLYVQIMLIIIVISVSTHLILKKTRKKSS